MTRPQIIEHDSGLMTYRLDVLNDKQREAIFSKWAEDEIMFISIGEVLAHQIILKTGDTFKIEFSMVGIKELTKI